TDAIAPAAQGQPWFVTGPIGWTVRFLGPHIALWNAGFALVQIAIGVGIMWRPTARLALGASFTWAVAVWWLGEGLGGLASGHGPARSDRPRAPGGDRAGLPGARDRPGRARPPRSARRPRYRDRRLRPHVDPGPGLRRSVHRHGHRSERRPPVRPARRGPVPVHHRGGRRAGRCDEGGHPTRRLMADAAALLPGD